MEKKTINSLKPSFTQSINIAKEWCNEWEEELVSDEVVADRINMKKLIDGPIYLELFVKVIPNWRKKESKLIELGYDEFI